MSISTNLEVSEFRLEGKILDFIIEDGNKLKGLILGTSEGEFYIKLAKNLRKNLSHNLQLTVNLILPSGTWLQVIGSKKYHPKKGKITFKAETIVSGRYQEHSINGQGQEKKQPVKKQTILYCQKSDCMKRGGKMMCQMLEKELGDRQLQDTVTIKGTGCMKNCQSGPNLVMPDKTRYTKVKTSQIPILVDKHFGEDVEIELTHLVQI